MNEYDLASFEALRKMGSGYAIFVGAPREKKQIAREALEFLKEAQAGSIFGGAPNYFFFYMRHCITHLAGMGVIDEHQRDALLGELQGVDSDIDLSNTGELKLAAKSFVFGLGFSALLHNIGWPKGDGKVEHPIWKIVREIKRKDPTVKQAAIICAARAQFKKAHPKSRIPSADNMEKAFARNVKNLPH